MCGFVDQGTGLSGGRSYEPSERQRGKVGRQLSHTLMELVTEFNMLRDHRILGIIVHRVSDCTLDCGKLDRNVAGLELLDICFNDVHIGVRSKRGLDERFMLLVLRVCDDFLHYADLSVSLRIKVKMRLQFVKENEDEPSTVAASRLAWLLFSVLSAAAS